MDIQSGLGQLESIINNLQQIINIRSAAESNQDSPVTKSQTSSAAPANTGNRANAGEQSLAEMRMAAGYLAQQLNGKLNIVVEGAQQTATETSALASSSILREGSRGEAVQELQDKLKEFNFNPGPSDGIFGPHTKAALMEIGRASCRERV